MSVEQGFQNLVALLLEAESNELGERVRARRDGLEGVEGMSGVEASQDTAGTKRGQGEATARKP
jgi:hypothetical protein